MDNATKNPFLPPYSARKLYSIFISVFIISIIPLTIAGVYFQQAVEKSLLNSNKTELKNLSVKVPSIKEGQSLNGLADIKVVAEDKTAAISSVSLLVNGTSVGTMNNLNETNDFSSIIALDTTKFKNGQVTLSATAKTVNGASLATNPIKVTIENEDAQAPTIDFGNLQDGTILPSKTEAISLNVSDNLGVAKVSLYADGELLKSFTSSPYNFSWSVNALNPGNHTIKAIAIDFVGNQRTAQITTYKPTTASEL